MPGFIGLPELIFFGLVVLLLFGPKRLPEMGRSMGKGLREFKESISGEDKEEPLDNQPAQTQPELMVVRDEAAIEKETK
jgi:sec-independent protein translocase protein TatA